ncbi:MAG: xanthine dehydrogenase family protein molybdopterin-binding subunit, partial [Alphaproteobacteria bacterium]
MKPEGIGASVRRKEDIRFLTGRGRFVPDIVFPGELHCEIVRSPHAHASLGALDIQRATAAPGVVAVFTGEDMAGDGIGPLTCNWRLTAKDGRPMVEPPRWALARGVVCHVGEPVAVVIAETRDRAADGAELVEIDYEERSAVVASREAILDGAPRLHPEAPGNVCFRWTRGDSSAVEEAFRGATHVTRIDLVNNRLAGAAIETRAVIGLVDPASDTLILHATTQTPHLVRRAVATELAMPEAKVRVISPDVGGGFGNKSKHYPEETIVAWAARRLGRPVKWIASRTESLVSDTQARDHVTHAELALDGEGHFLALRVETLANLGAYVSTWGAAIPSAIYSGLLAGMYRTPAIHVEVTGVFTNTVPVDSYRGAGRPEACYVLERLADRAGRELGLDRAEIRRRNLIQAAAMPYATPIGPTYDSGDFPKLFERVLEVSAYASFPARRKRSAQHRLLRGIGIACYIESSGVAPSRLVGPLGARGGFFESAEVRVDPEGGVVARLGTHNHGQGHATTFAQILADRLGVPLDRIEIEEGDTAVVPFGTGTFGSRSIAVGGSALDRAAVKIVAKGKKIAAHILEASEADVDFRDGGFVVAGTDRRLAFADVARAAHAPHDYPQGVEPGLHEVAFYDPPSFAFSNGVHVAEVEIDPETGVVRPVGYWVVDDFGVVINPMVVEGQVHGGLAQGIGQALKENYVYEPGSGQPLSGSFMDYALPRADEQPPFVSELDQSQPCTHNPLGAKGCGESGAIGAPAAVTNAIL